MERFNDITKSFWSWLTNRKFEVEHLGMAAVIAISTWHVSQHMKVVEDSTIIAVIMGAVLGFLNAVFAMRFFEEQGRTRGPAGVGVLFSAIVSVWIQYGFYDENSDLARYMVGNFNVNALMFGGWAPVFEVLLGWLYGVRLYTRMEKQSVMDAIQAKYEKMMADLRAKFDGQLTTTQQVRDDAHRTKIDLSNALLEVQALTTAKNELAQNYQREIEQLKEKLSDYRAQNAALDATVKAVKVAPITPVQPAQSDGQLTTKLSTEERRAELLKLAKHNPHITVVDLSKRLGAVRNTIKSDLDALQDAGLIHRNGVIEVKG